MKISLLIFNSLIFISTLGCTVEDSPENDANLSRSEYLDASQVKLEMKITFLRNISSSTIYGEPPQLAVWIVEQSSNITKTIYVTRRTALNKWVGKLYCKVSLPYWEVSTGMREKSKSLRKNNLDALTSATSPADQLIIESILDTGKVWNYFIEVNLSGDYNKSFPLYPKDVHIDTEGNGQPSLVYSGQIISKKGSSSTPRLIGRTFQTRVEDTLNTDLSGITTAKNIIKSVLVKAL